MVPTKMSNVVNRNKSGHSPAMTGGHGDHGIGRLPRHLRRDDMMGQFVGDSHIQIFIGRLKSREYDWLVVLTILKNMSLSMGRMTSHI